MSEGPNYQVTGNEYVSLPTIRESDGAVEGVSFLYQAVKGMIELKGRGGFLRPYVQCGGRDEALRPVWSRAHCWIPSFVSGTEDTAFRCTYLPPVGERGFGLRLEGKNKGQSPREITLGVRGDWAETLHTVNESIPLTEGKKAVDSYWNHMFVFQQVPGAPLMAFAPIVGDDQPFSEIDQGAAWERDGFAYAIHKTALAGPGETVTLDVFFGVGYEQVAAAASAKEMLRQGFDALLRRTEDWLARREKPMDDPVLHTILNTNLFFCFFFASGRAVDTEELCMMTSRSPRYYVSAAYWDRDSLLWAFPAIVETDAAYARELLLSVFRVQGRNFGVHSRYIDGTVLEPGFELDELCAPVIALKRYLDKTGDRALLARREILCGLETVLRGLEGRKHPDIDLYGTFLQPSDDLRKYPYLTYDNVLAWAALRCLGAWLDRPELAERAERVRDAIRERCVFDWEGRPVFAWSTDLEGHWDVYDEPPGSLQLLPFYGFCERDDPVWQNTAALIRSAEYPLSFAGCPIAEIGCRHAPHPWVLALCNSLLSGHREEALRHLRLTKLDNGVACESVHEETGACATGAAFATCAGFLAFAMLTETE